MSTFQLTDTENGFDLSGFIDADMELSSLLESERPHLILNLKKISEISSVGVKKWVECMQTILKQGKTLEYRECPEVFIEQCNMLLEITENLSISSFYVTFECEECDEYVTKLLVTSELDLQNLPPKVSCPSCQNLMPPENDEIFYFLTM